MDTKTGVRVCVRKSKGQRDAKRERGKEGRREGGKEGRREGGKEGRMEREKNRFLKAEPWDRHRMDTVVRADTVPTVAAVVPPRCQAKGAPAPPDHAIRLLGPSRRHHISSSVPFNPEGLELILGVAVPIK